MLWHLWLLCVGLWPSLGHVRLLPSTTWRSLQLFPQQQWLLRNHSSTVKPVNMKLQPGAYCVETQFRHNYKVLTAAGEVKLEPHLNYFARTQAGEWASMRDLCLDEKRLPWRQLCNATGHWITLGKINCDPGSALSRQLNNIREEVSQEGSKPDTLTKLQNLVSQVRGQLSAVDIYSTAQIFAQVFQQQYFEKAVSADVVSICSNVMSCDRQVLRLSAEVNATNSLLRKFEDYMNALPHQLVPFERCGVPSNVTLPTTGKNVETINFSGMGVHALMTTNLSVFYVNPACELITGIAIYSAEAESRRCSKSGFWYRFLYGNESLEQLRGEQDLRTASYLPQKLWLQLQEKGASYIILKVYAHDGLFVDKSQGPNQRPHRVLSISIPGFEGTKLPALLPFLMPRAAATDHRSHCGYWNYGNWATDGVRTFGGNSDYANVLCYTEHLTQFAFLVGGSYVQQKMDGPQLQLVDFHEQLLNMITQLGCGLSLFGLLAIFLTAALVKKWRSQASTKVLLHLCLALALQLILFAYLGAEQTPFDRNWCLISGAALHYSVLLIFSWMLIIAFLQFQRYVTVIGINRPNHYILVAALMAWTLPVIPTLLVVFLDGDSIKPLNQQLNSQAALCYPSGHGLALGVVLPIGLVTVANGSMMLSILYSIHRALNPRRKLIMQQLRLSVLLFFLLGLTWVFGLCSYMQLGILFSYLFCLSATLEGFVLFVYFVLMNASNRLAWMSLVCSKQLNGALPITEQQSMSTSSSNTFKRTPC